MRPVAGVWNIEAPTRPVEKADHHWHGHEFRTKTGKMGWQGDYTRDPVPARGFAQVNGPGAGGGIPVIHRMNEYPKSIPQMGAEVRAFAASVLPLVASGRQIAFTLINARKAKAVEVEIGEPMGSGGPEIIVDDHAVHSQNEHPKLTLDDWEQLPDVANNFDAVFLSTERGRNKEKRVAVVKQINDREAYLYIADVVHSSKQGKPGHRLTLTTFMRDHINTVADRVTQKAARPEDVEAWRLNTGVDALSRQREFPADPGLRLASRSIPPTKG